jgi:hypothetical protein
MTAMTAIPVTEAQAVTNAPQTPQTQTFDLTREQVGVIRRRLIGKLAEIADALTHAAEGEDHTATYDIYHEQMVPLADLLVMFGWRGREEGARGASRCNATRSG